ncbi:TPA: DNA polymerase IV [Legionella pneumophila]|uniref:DNA polymerase IV n=2 Tax=Legionella pneumophila TaxID=446 RepID=DPO4_LEGPH|nr:DNA polymerase IV [Legionella pneumophila]Q5ZY20.1 RecName: Full=DNA polymerase IV; Short=Pol IV [Legionella pneumophila subsp. pneumophila str. Philadelphia 1]WBV62697.1 DNA polymerase IV [Legionella pneumophila 130b]AAU26649.1 DNA-damage inducible protein P [Legionella pneumophila subsp. pneumophila str. Philadelphia 1]AEW50835.1 DNA-damage inducible protein P [Legionella pneumophila subsp. pneumophila ATCC 43290]AGH54754.1 DNA polymerase IV [Legionella pneumophila subsp. pneumophila LPE5
MNPIRKIIHIDMDCFYAAIEMRDFPELANKPIAVGGDAKRRGVIATCNYAARQFGIRSAMPTAHALKLCRELILRPVRMDVYQKESQYIRSLLTEYTDLIEPLSLDEAYLDVTESTQCQGSATWIAEEIRARIYQARQLTASAGIAPNKSLAKIASDWHKPNGQMVIRPEDVSAFVLDLPVRKLFGVGPKMEEKLRALNIKTCADLQRYSIEYLLQKFGTMGQRLYELARGIDNRPVNPERIRKSISVEETYPKDLPNSEACLAVLPDLMARLEARIQRAGKISGIHNLFVKLKFNDFQQTTIERVMDKLDLIVLRQLIQEGFARRGMPVRLLGIGIKLKQENTYQSVQLPLLDL